MNSLSFPHSPFLLINNSSSFTIMVPVQQDKSNNELSSLPSTAQSSTSLIAFPPFGYQQIYPAGFFGFCFFFPLFTIKTQHCTQLGGSCKEHCVTPGISGFLGEMLECALQRWAPGKGCLHFTLCSARQRASSVGPTALHLPHCISSNSRSIW